MAESHSLHRGVSHILLMKIHTEKIPEMTIEEYADANGLEMVVRERPVNEGANDRFYASFKNLDVKGNHVLIGTHGNGPTQEAAIADYGKRIHLETTVINGWDDKTRREIKPVRIVANDPSSATADAGRELQPRREPPLAEPPCSAWRIIGLPGGTYIRFPFDEAQEGYRAFIAAMGSPGVAVHNPETDDWTTEWCKCACLGGEEYDD